MSSDLETSHEAAANESIGSSQEEIVTLPSTPTTPKAGLSQNRKSRTPATEKRKKSTPDPAKLEAKRQRLEEKAKRDEKKKQEEEEKQKRIQERRMQQQQRDEAKRKADEEKQREKEEKRKQQEEKKRIADEEKRAKLEEKQKRDDEKRVKEEEKLKKQEEKRKQMEEKQRQDDEKNRQLEEEIRRKKRASEKFTTFFKKAPATPTSSSTAKTFDDNVTLAFRPFELKPNQILVPLVKDFVRERFEIGVFDSLFEGQYESEELYLKELKSGIHKPVKAGMRVRKSQDKDIVVIGEDSKKFKAKLLQFHTNTRPAWCGTWNKRSNHVNARRPFGRDTKWFDYDVDSDDEWEEEEAGESLSGSDNEEPEDDYEIDNEFMVPHGYLSGEEEENAEEDAPGDETSFREKEMIARKNMRVKLLRPVAIGCVWSHHLNQGQHEAASDILKKYQIVFNKAIKS